MIANTEATVGRKKNGSCSRRGPLFQVPCVTLFECYSVPIHRWETNSERVQPSTQIHTAGTWGTWNPNPGPSDFKAHAVNCHSFLTEAACHVPHQSSSTGCSRQGSTGCRGQEEAVQWRSRGREGKGGRKSFLEELHSC